MKHNSHTLYIRLIAVILLVVFMVPIRATASTTEITPRASDYLDSYNSYLYNAAWGRIRVYYDVTGTNYMDEIGTLKIQIYESTDNVSWTWVTTYRHDTTSGMLANNEVYHSGYVEYAGTIGRYYKAYVCVWAGKNGAGDTRYFWTPPVKATLLPG